MSSSDGIHKNIRSSSQSNLNISRLNHFLYMGNEGTRYLPFSLSSKQFFSAEEVNLVNKNKGCQFVQKLVDVVNEKQTICMEAVLFALSLCICCDDKVIKSAAYKAVPVICTSPEYLFILIRHVHKSPLSGWGRGLRKAVSQWYSSHDLKSLAFKVTECMSHKGWTHKDVMKLSHIKFEDAGMNAIVTYVLKGVSEFEKICNENASATSAFSKHIFDVHKLKHTTDEHSAANIIAEIENVDLAYVPCHLLKSKEVWCALIKRFPVSILILQLSRFRRLGFLKQNHVVLTTLLERLRQDFSTQNDSSLMPVDVFIALKKYEIFGKSTNSPSRLSAAMSYEKANSKHKPNSKLLESLNNLFFESFKALKPTGKRFLIAVDVRHPMTHSNVISNKILTPAVASALLIMNLVRQDNSSVVTMAFGSKGLKSLDINNKMTLNDITKRMKETAMGTVTLAEPMIWSKNTKKYIDVFIVCTDTQIYPGDIHPAEALKEYRNSMNLPDAKFIMCAMCTKRVSIAPPEEPGMLDIIGFDSKTPRVINDFATNIF